MANVLAAVAARFDQAGVVADLGYFLSKPGVMKRNPVLLIFVRHALAYGADLTPGNITGAVLVYEYQLSGIPTGLYSSNDRSGRSTLLAPAHRRAELAAAASRYLLHHGAHVVLMSFRCDPPSDDTAADDVKHTPHALWAIRQRDLPEFMQLKSSFDETLAAVGQRTRRNLRYYRRRAESDLGCTFFPHVDISLPEFQAFNKQSMYAVSESVAAWRHRALREIESPLLMGIKDRDGRWLSIVGARRVGPHSEILWQMNRDGMPNYSLSLVMRNYFIEHEIAHGATRLYFEGGSGHPIRNSFVSGAVTDMAVLRRSIPAFMTRKVARHLIDEENDLARMLFDPQVNWNTFGSWPMMARAVPKPDSQTASPARA